MTFEDVEVDMLLYRGDVASCDDPSLTKEPVVETARRSTLPLVFTGATVFCVVSPQQPNWSVDVPKNS